VVVLSHSRVTILFFIFLHKVIIIIIIKNPVKISKKGKTNLKEHIIYGTHVLPENRQKYTNTVNWLSLLSAKECVVISSLCALMLIDLFSWLSIHVFGDVLTTNNCVQFIDFSDDFLVFSFLFHCFFVWLGKSPTHSAQKLSFSVILNSDKKKRNILGYEVLWFHIFYICWGCMHSIKICAITSAKFSNNSAICISAISQLGQVIEQYNISAIIREMFMLIRVNFHGKTSWCVKIVEVLV